MRNTSCSRSRVLRLRLAIALSHRGQHARQLQVSPLVAPRRSADVLQVAQRHPRRRTHAPQHPLEFGRSRQLSPTFANVPIAVQRQPFLGNFDIKSLEILFRYPTAFEFLRSRTLCQRRHQKLGRSKEGRPSGAGGRRVDTGETRGRPGGLGDYLKSAAMGRKHGMAMVFCCRGGSKR